MKKFDPTLGWMQQSSETDESDPTAEAFATPETSERTIQHHADIYHFSRQGKRLNISETGSAEEDFKFEKTAETTDMLLQLFEKLDQADKTKEVLVRLSDSLQKLEELHIREQDLAEQLAGTRQAMEALHDQAQKDMINAQVVEDTNLKIRQYRRQLLEKLAVQFAKPNKRAI